MKSIWCSIDRFAMWRSVRHSKLTVNGPDVRAPSHTCFTSHYTGAETGPLVAVGERRCLGVHRGSHPAAAGHAVCVPAPHMDRRGAPGRCHVPQRHPDLGTQRCEACPREGQEEVNTRPTCRQDPRSSCKGLPHIHVVLAVLSFNKLYII